MSERREYTLQLLQDQSGRTASVHVTQGGKAVTPPEPETPKETGLLTVSPETINLLIYMDSDGEPGGGGGVSHSLEVTSAKISIKSQLLDSTGKMIRPLDVDFSVTPEDSHVSVYNKVADINGNITAEVSSEISRKGGPATGVLHITQRETGIEKTVPVTVTRE